MKTSMRNTLVLLALVTLSIVVEHGHADPFDPPDYAEQTAEWRSDSYADVLSLR